MSDHTPNTQVTPPEVSQDDSIDHSRRKLTGAALGVSAVFTLASRPVWANQCTISGMASGNLSTPGGVACAGCTPGYWLNHPMNWPTDYLPGTCLECQPTGGGNKCKEWDDDGTAFPFPSTTYNGKTMMQVLAMNGNEDPYQLGAHAIAALLNAAAAYPPGYSFGYSVGEITELWSRYAGDPEGLKNIYASLNERSCPLGNEDDMQQCSVSSVSGKASFLRGD
ncbi:MAG: hypothetical protein K0M46_04930 [Thiobacillus sp.]|nr:hypothetical protein [Thiobacillus sp.]